MCCSVAVYSWVIVGVCDCYPVAVYADGRGIWPKGTVCCARYGSKTAAAFTYRPVPLVGQTAAVCYISCYGQACGFIYIHSKVLWLPCDSWALGVAAVVLAAGATAARAAKAVIIGASAA